MKLILKIGAIASHPIFLPFFSLLVYAPLVAKYGQSAILLSLIWIAFVYLFLPLIFLKYVRKINLAEPNLEERRSIYKAYTLINFGFAVVSIFIMKEYFSFFISAGFLHVFMLLLAFVDLKASWHTATWAFLFSAGLMVMYNYQLVGLDQMLLVVLGILILVAFIRWKAKAHTPFELIMGVAAGLISALPILFF
jgi:hypothetical protein|tara:strand:+ start:2800 stop:3381 length:582 start_codon:yes stop_codon:yes gene_type:complete